MVIKFSSLTFVLQLYIPSSNLNRNLLVRKFRNFFQRRHDPF